MTNVIKRCIIVKVKMFTEMESVMTMTFKSRHFIPLTVLFLALGMLFNTTQVLAQAQTSDPSVIKEPLVLTIGDTFEYKGYRSMDDAKEDVNPRWTQVLKVTEVYEGRGFRFEINGGPRYIIYNQAGNILKRSRKDSTIRTYTPSSMLFKYPMKVGDEFPVSYYFDKSKVTPNKRTVRREGIVRVVGWEEVTVPAGTFKALRIEMSGEYKLFPRDQGGRGGTFVETYWVSPKVKMRIVLSYRKYVWKNGTVKKHYFSLSSFNLVNQ